MLYAAGPGRPAPMHSPAQPGAPFHHEFVPDQTRFLRQSLSHDLVCGKVAMSLPGDRDAQRMLLGEVPLSRGRALRPPGPQPARSDQRAPRRADSLPCQKQLERKADPGIGAQARVTTSPLTSHVVEL